MFSFYLFIVCVAVFVTAIVAFTDVDYGEEPRTVIKKSGFMLLGSIFWPIALVVAFPIYLVVAYKRNSWYKP